MNSSDNDEEDDEEDEEDERLPYLPCIPCIFGTFTFYTSICRTTHTPPQGHLPFLTPGGKFIGLRHFLQ